MPPYIVKAAKCNVGGGNAVHSGREYLEMCRMMRIIIFGEYLLVWGMLRIIMFENI